MSQGHNASAGDWKQNINFEEQRFAPSSEGCPRAPRLSRLKAWKACLHGNGGNGSMAGLSSRRRVGGRARDAAARGVPVRAGARRIASERFAEAPGRARTECRAAGGIAGHGRGGTGPPTADAVAFRPRADGSGSWGDHGADRGSAREGPSRAASAHRGGSPQRTGAEHARAGTAGLDERSRLRCSASWACKQSPHQADPAATAESNEVSVVTRTQLDRTTSRCLAAASSSALSSGMPASTPSMIMRCRIAPSIATLSSMAGRRSFRNWTVGGS